MTKKKICYLTKYSVYGPSSRERIYCYQNFLLKNDFKVRIYYLLGKIYLQKFTANIKNKFIFYVYVFLCYVKRIFELGLCFKSDIVIIEQELFPYIPAGIEIFILKILCVKKTGIEFDDAVYLTPHKSDKMPELLKKADFAVVGNIYLKKTALKYNANIYVLPTGVKLEHNINKKVNLKPVIGWTGLACNLKYIEKLADVFKQLKTEYDFELAIMSNIKPEMNELNYKFMKWSPVNEKNFLRSIDIGIMPLENSEWEQGKCGYKLLLYMSKGIPSIASPVGINKHIIDSGVNGFLAEEEAEWKKYISLLIRDNELRKKFSEESFKTVEKYYSKKVVSNKLLKMIENEIN